MKEIRQSNEAQMILEFLKGEISSKRFHKDICDALSSMNLDEVIINNGDITNEQENFQRLKVMKLFRGYPDDELFENFPQINEWKLMELNESFIWFIDIRQSTKSACTEKSTSFYLFCVTMFYAMLFFMIRVILSHRKIIAI